MFYNAFPNQWLSNLVLLQPTVRRPSTSCPSTCILRHICVCIEINMIKFHKTLHMMQIFLFYSFVLPNVGCKSLNDYHDLRNKWPFTVKKIPLSWAVLAGSLLIFIPENNPKPIQFSNTRFLVFEGFTLEISF